MKLYLVNFKYYNEYTDSENASRTFYAFAEDLAHLGSTIETMGIKYIENLNIKVINDDCDANIFYIPEGYDTSTLNDENFY